VERLVSFLRRNERATTIAAGAFVGVVTGYGAMACHAGIRAIARLVFGHAGDVAELAAEPGVAPLTILLLPAVGGLLVAPITWFGAREAQGHGVPEVMGAIARRGGVIRPRVGVLKALASVLTIGTGGSVGWEGPIIQIGSSFGSTLGQLGRVARRQMRVLVACGAAAGIAVAFKAPIAGVLFSVEIFLGDLAVTMFAPVVVAAVVGTGVAHAHEGHRPVLDLASLDLHVQTEWELFAFAALGLICAVGAVFYTRVLYFFEDFVGSSKVHPLARPALGGLVLGAIGLAFPQVLGVGYTTIEATLAGSFTLQILCALFFVKLVATCITLGSGGSGGIFGPSLVLGSVMGAGFGEILGQTFPGAVGPPGLYAVVGMAALVAGATHAPLSAMLIIFEMTQDYSLILPLMVACILGTITARGLYRDSIYTLKLSRRGIKLRGGRDATVLSAMHVSETMRKDPVLLPESATFEEVRKAALHAPQHVFPVVDGAGKLRGIIPLDVLRPFLFEDALQHVAIAGDLLQKAETVLEPSDTLEDARRAFLLDHHDEICVVDPYTGEVVGLLREHDLHAAYNRALETLE